MALVLMLAMAALVVVKHTVLVQGTSGQGNNGGSLPQHDGDQNAAGGGGAGAAGENAADGVLNAGDGGIGATNDYRNGVATSITRAVAAVVAVTVAVTATYGGRGGGGRGGYAVLTTTLVSFSHRRPS